MPRRVKKPSLPAMFHYRLERYSKWNEGVGEYDSSWEPDVICSGETKADAMRRVINVIEACGPYREFTINACTENGDDLDTPEEVSEPAGDDNDDDDQSWEPAFRLNRHDPTNIDDEEWTDEEIEEYYLAMSRQAVDFAKARDKNVINTSSTPDVDKDDPVAANLVDFMKKSAIQVNSGSTEPVAEAPTFVEGEV